MEEVMIGFTKDDLDMIMEYQQVSGAVTVQAAIMNAISLALDHADDDVEIEVSPLTDEDLDDELTTAIKHDVADKPGFYDGKPMYGTYNNPAKLY